MPLPLAQSRVLRFVADTGPATARQVARGLRMDRDTARNALRLLTDKGLLTADMFALPVTHAVTDAGKEALAAGDGA
jgi:DNA-binding transcriptional ArsR family regulator